MLPVWSLFVLGWQQPPASAPLPREISLSERGLKTKAVYDAFEFNFKRSEKDIRREIQDILQAYQKHPVSYSMWLSWVMTAQVRYKDREGAMATARRLVDQFHELNMDWVLDDDATKVVGEWPEFREMQKALEAKRASELRKLNPLSIGLDPDANRTRLAEMRLRDPMQVYRTLKNWNLYDQPKRTGAWIMRTIRAAQPVNRYSLPQQYLVYIPKGYRATRPHRALTYLYGGWMSASQTRPFWHQMHLSDNPFFSPNNLLDASNLIQIYPLNQPGADPVKPGGGSVYADILADAKSYLNIDDSRCYMAGFSDGGTATFELARENPTDYAALFPMNGYPLFRRNLRNLGERPLISYSGVEDDLYPIASIRKVYGVAAKRNTKWEAVEVKGVGHDSLYYQDSVVPDILRRMDKETRNPLPSAIVLEGAENEPTRRDWLQIVKVDPGMAAADWHDEWKILGKTSEDKPAMEIILNQGQGMVKAQYENNIFKLSTSRVSQVKLFLHPDMVDLSREVEVVVNGVSRFKGKVELSAQYIWRGFSERFDRQALWAAELVVPTA
ncbi:MAG: hypothetical protein JST40_14450 [Armatimonadetes bacterium]|nr:hypothetical protein [Armatimonadota bacterium]